MNLPYTQSNHWSMYCVHCLALVIQDPSQTYLGCQGLNLWISMWISCSTTEVQPSCSLDISWERHFRCIFSWQIFVNRRIIFSKHYLLSPSQSLLLSAAHKGSQADELESDERYWSNTSTCQITCIHLSLRNFLALHNKIRTIFE